MDEYQTIIANLERLRTNYGLELDEVDSLGKLKKGTYKNVVEGKAILNLIDLISIVKIYLPDPSKVFNPKMRMPAFKDIPNVIKGIAAERLGKAEKQIEKKDRIYYCVLILDKYFNIGDEFTNSQINGYFKEELEKTFKGKSIEWSKSILSPFIEDTEKTQPGKTKPEKVYRLIQAIPRKMVGKAKEIVDDEWLQEILKK